MPHNDILNDRRIKAVFDDFLQEHPQMREKIVTEKEPDYMFVVNLKR